MLAVHGRTQVFVDGFNLYHGIKALAHHKWLDIMVLCRHYAPAHRLEQVHYYSAFAFHAPAGTVERHRRYLAALRSTGIEVTLGRFKKKTIVCRASCGEAFESHEEKETDVNLAIAIVEGAVLNRYDSAVLISGDTDILPALKAAKRHGKKVYALFPPHRKNDDLVNFCDGTATIRLKQLEKCLLPDPVITAEGREIKCPDEWK